MIHQLHHFLKLLRQSLCISGGGSIPILYLSKTRNTTLKKKTLKTLVQLINPTQNSGNLLISTLSVWIDHI